MYRESDMEAYITVCKIVSQQEYSVPLRTLKKGLCINLDEWDGEGDGREASLQMVTAAMKLKDFCSLEARL